MYRLIFVEGALEDFSSAFGWYESKVAGLGGEFEFAIKSKLDAIKKSPLQFASKRKGYREAKVQRFPFVIVFCVLEAKRTLLVTAIHHTSKSSRKKYRRPKR